MFPAKRKHCTVRATARNTPLRAYRRRFLPMIMDHSTNGATLFKYRHRVQELWGWGPSGGWTRLQPFRKGGGYEATDTGLAYAPVSQAHGHNHRKGLQLVRCGPAT